MQGMQTLTNLFGGLFQGSQPRAQAQPRVSSPEQAEGDLISLVQTRYNWARTAKEPQLKLWATCLAFYVGQHYRQWDRRARRLVEPRSIPSWRVQMVDNQVPGMVETAAAKLARARQLPKALANTDDEEDVAGAEAGTKFLEHWWAVDGMEEKELEANVHRILFGTAFYHDYWDQNKTAKVPVYDEMGKMQVERAVVGDVSTEVLSVFDVFPEPVERWDDVGWIIVARRKPLRWFRDTFGDKGKQITAEEASAESVFETLLPGALAGDMSQSGAPAGEGTATLKILYENPSKAFPKGRHAMIAGTTVLFQADTLPLPHGEIPVTQKGYRFVPKRLWFAGLVESVISQQRELNRSESYMAENLRLHGRPQKMWAKEAKIDANAGTTSPDEILEWTSAGGVPPPGYLQPPNLAAWVADYPDKQRAAMQQVVGQHEVSNAQVPTGVKSGIAIDLLQKQDDTRLSVANLFGKRALERLASHVLQTAVERYREPRLIQTLGKSQERQVMALMGSDIGDRDVLVEVTEGVADTKAARAQKFIDWMSTGLFDKVFAHQYPVAFARDAFHELGENWVVDALDAGIEEQQAMEAQQAQQMHAEQAQAQGQMDGQMQAQAEAQQADLALKQQAQDQASQAQQAQVQSSGADRAMKLMEMLNQAHQSQADRAHQVGMAAMVARQKAQERPRAGAGR